MPVVIGARAATITAIVTAVNEEEKKRKEESEKKSLHRTRQDI
jgi:hypothetical protein